ncbi:MAG: hypothetical protein V1670_03050, partial [Candidatus Omnitrophota bacterium]
MSLWGTSLIIVTDGGGRQEIVKVEIGFGKLGDFLFENASVSSEELWIGMEVHPEALHNATERIKEAGIRNIKIIPVVKPNDLMEREIESIENFSLDRLGLIIALENNLKADSISGFYINYPNTNIVIFDRELLEKLYNYLTFKGEIVIVTESKDYANAIAKSFSRTKGFDNYFSNLADGYARGEPNHFKDKGWVYNPKPEEDYRLYKSRYINDGFSKVYYSRFLKQREKGDSSILKDGGAGGETKKMETSLIYNDSVLFKEFATAIKELNLPEFNFLGYEEKALFYFLRGYSSKEIRKILNISPKEMKTASSGLCGKGLIRYTYNGGRKFLINEDKMPAHIRRRFMNFEHAASSFFGSRKYEEVAKMLKSKGFEPTKLNIEKEIAYSNVGAEINGNNYLVPLKEIPARSRLINELKAKGINLPQCVINYRLKKISLIAETKVRFESKVRKTVSLKQIFSLGVIDPPYFFPKIYKFLFSVKDVEERDKLLKELQFAASTWPERFLLILAECRGVGTYKDNINEFLEKVSEIKNPELAQLREIIKSLVLEKEDINKRANGGKTAAEMQTTGTPVIIPNNNNFRHKISSKALFEFIDNNKLDNQITAYAFRRYEQGIWALEDYLVKSGKLAGPPEEACVASFDLKSNQIVFNLQKETAVKILSDTKFENPEELWEFIVQHENFHKQYPHLADKDIFSLQTEIEEIKSCQLCILKRTRYLGLIRKEVNSRGNKKTALYIGSGGDISTARGATGGEKFIFVDALRFEPAENLSEQEWAIKKEDYFRDKAKGWSSSKTLHFDIDCAKFPILWELERLGAENITINFNKELLSNEISFNLPGEEEVTKIVYFRVHQAYSIENYTKTLLWEIKKGIDFCIIKAFPLTNLSKAVQDLIIGSLNEQGMIITDNERQWLLNYPEIFTNIESKDIRYYEYNNDIWFGYGEVYLLRKLKQSVEKFNPIVLEVEFIKKQADGGKLDAGQAREAGQEIILYTLDDILRSAGRRFMEEAQGKGLKKKLWVVIWALKTFSWISPHWGFISEVERNLRHAKGDEALRDVKQDLERFYSRNYSAQKGEAKVIAAAKPEIEKSNKKSRKMHYWTKEIFLRDLKSAVDELGTTFSTVFINKRPDIYGAYDKHKGEWGYKKWNQAIKEAGLQPAVHWTKEIFLEKLREAIKDCGSISSYVIGKRYPALYAKFHAYKDEWNFANWKQAVKEAGFQPVSNWSSADFLQELRKIIKELGDSSYLPDRKKYRYIYAAYYRYGNKWGLLKFKPLVAEIRQELFQDVRKQIVRQAEEEGKIKPGDIPVQAKAIKPENKSQAVGRIKQKAKKESSFELTFNEIFVLEKLLLGPVSKDPMALLKRGFSVKHRVTLANLKDRGFLKETQAGFELIESLKGEIEVTGLKEKKTLSWILEEINNICIFKKVEKIEFLAKNDGGVEQLKHNALRRNFGVNALANALPYYTNKAPDSWREFCRIKRELSGNGNIKIAVLSGRWFKNDIEINCIDLPLRKSFPRCDSFEGYFIDRFTANIREKEFLRHTLDNINQHVKKGVVLVARQEEMTEIGQKHIKVTVIDNGPGFIDKHSKSRVSIEKAIAWKKTYGSGGYSGVGLTYAVGREADLSVIKIPGQTALIGKYCKNNEVISPEIILNTSNNKKFGTAVSGYFYKGDDLEQWRQDVIRELAGIAQENKDGGQGSFEAHPKVLLEESKVITEILAEAKDKKSVNINRLYLLGLVKEPYFFHIISGFLNPFISDRRRQETRGLLLEAAELAPKRFVDILDELKIIEKYKDETKKFIRVLYETPEFLEIAKIIFKEKIKKELSEYELVTQADIDYPEKTANRRVLAIKILTMTTENCYNLGLKVSTSLTSLLVNLLKYAQR